MRFALMIEPQQGLTYEEQLAIVRRAESVGFESFFRSDHYQSFPGPSGGPTTDAWAVLAGLARETSTITLGTLVSPVTFRPVGNLAKVVTTVDEMSGGRVEFGLGAGWNEPEHRQLGLPFPEIKERADLMEEQFAVLRGLWGEPDGWSFEGATRHDRGRVVPPEAGRPAGSAGLAERRVPAAAPHRWRGFATFVADRRALHRRVQPVVVVTRDGGHEVRGARERHARRSDGIPATMARSVMSGVLIGRDEAELRPAKDRAPGGLRQRVRRGRLVRRGGRAGCWARRTRPGRWSRGSRRRAPSG